MILNVFRYDGRATRSLVGAVHVVSVEVETIPDNQDLFAREHGGDFCELEADLADADLLERILSYEGDDGEERSS